MGKIKLDGYICERCEHIWVPRFNKTSSQKKPLVCPKCKSPYWNIPRKVKIKKEIKNE